ncbi:MAG TPA: DUF4266 domain-containing protein [Polyangiaceae bacterium]
MKPRLSVAAFAALACTSLTGCATVPQNRRALLADPMMGVTDEPLDAARRQKLYDTREGAAGGDGTTAGGGCDCQ